MNEENMRATRLEAELLFLLFLGLKLTGNIDWSWWWVFAPIWGIMLLGGLALAVARLALKKRRIELLARRVWDGRAGE